MKKTLLYSLFLGLTLSSTVALGGVINTFGTTGQYSIDDDFDVSVVNVVTASNPGSGNSVGTFGHGRTDLYGLNSIGNVYANVADTALFIGDSYSPDGRNSFDQSIVELVFQNAITNNNGWDFALITGAGVDSRTVDGFYTETVSVGVDSSNFWYQAPAEYVADSTLQGYGYAVHLYDLSSLGVSMGATVSSLFVSNFDVFSTVSGADGLSGWIDFAGTTGNRIEGGFDLAGPKEAGANSYYYPLLNGNGENIFRRWHTDPDLIYAGAVSVNEVPEPAAFFLISLGLLMLGLRKRKQALVN
uniref:Ice-binding protein C-terminal domain-containing protein n=1 Tax=Rheinheimera sp. BAL341 TaxID=1708203 RepID=A0A486XH08_9GAMM